MVDTECWVRLDQRKQTLPRRPIHFDQKQRTGVPALIGSIEVGEDPCFIWILGQPKRIQRDSGRLRETRPETHTALNPPGHHFPR
ncbi:hypothetical protein [Burkholderia sp. Ac-20392]|uniref:hypothetical protein n=1 Tax=Burkholderia sp. Ac-20392 TaxID=2703905 RepID=UPI0019820FDA|nr:hypothetical protein [Burkholderia sp. Ac-20392]MBN3793949.1 hypothetical protein [Burkholderia sp. Ac-20392]